VRKLDASNGEKIASRDSTKLQAKEDDNFARSPAHYIRKVLSRRLPIRGTMPIAWKDERQRTMRFRQLDAVIIENIHIVIQAQRRAPHPDASVIGAQLFASLATNARRAL
jgi:hypothetical protein